LGAGGASACQLATTGDNIRVTGFRDKLRRDDAQALCFGSLPFRAFPDRKLKLLPMRVLGVISGHDQFNANGQGCWASNRRVAELIGCHPKSASRAIRWLIKHGYLKDLGAPPGKQRGRRRRFLSVIYNEADVTAFKVTAQVPQTVTAQVPQREKRIYPGKPVALARGQTVDIGRLCGAPGRPLPALQADLAKQDAARLELARQLGRGDLTKGFAILGKIPDARRRRHV
jgi:hypothetical protein